DAPIVHPAHCGYPCAHLCAAGVALKLAEALQAPTAAEDLDLAALATVADVVPLTGENRRLVREGLRALSGASPAGTRPASTQPPSASASRRASTRPAACRARTRASSSCSPTTPS